MLDVTSGFSSTGGTGGTTTAAPEAAFWYRAGFPDRRTETAVDQDEDYKARGFTLGERSITD